MLEQARHLAKRDRRRPQQGNLRRAVSTAYYALFHFLIDRASRFLVGSSGDRTPLRQLLSRAFSHADVALACKSFSGGTLPATIGRYFAGMSIPAQVQNLAETLGLAQQLRHRADYDLAASFNRNDVLSLIDDVEQRIEEWQQVETDPAARLLLVSLLIWERIRRH
ncbi:MAG: hypothetical protein KY476_05550 [Planctomycetes bacterium]|nr:hypothetical protein [Planctomycetota bacterium]